MKGRSVVIAQARTASARLPSKVLETLAGQSVLAHVLERCKAIDGIDAVCCATSTNAADDRIAEMAAHMGVAVYRGSEVDVLDRYNSAALMLCADTILRVTCDCPLLDPDVCAAVLALLESESADYASNNLTYGWPHGLDCEAFTTDALHRATAEATVLFDREHVTPWMRRHATLRRANLPGPGGNVSHMRWTLDYPEDLHFLREIFSRIQPSDRYSWHHIAALIEAEPSLAEINCGRIDPQRLLSRV